MTSFNLISNVSIMFGFTTLPFSSTKKLTFTLPLSSHQLIVGSERVMSSIVRFSGFFTIGYDSHQILTLIGLAIMDPSVINTLSAFIGTCFSYKFGCYMFRTRQPSNHDNLMTIKIKYKGSIVKSPYLCKFNVSFLLDS